MCSLHGLERFRAEVEWSGRIVREHCREFLEWERSLRRCLDDCIRSIAAARRNYPEIDVVIPELTDVLAAISRVSRPVGSTSRMRSGSES